MVLGIEYIVTFDCFQKIAERNLFILILMIYTVKICKVDA